MSSLTIIYLFISIIYLYSATLRTDITYTSPSCGDDYKIGKEESYTSGSSYKLCLVINNVYKVQFFPVCDTFTLLEVDKSFLSNVYYNKSIANKIHVEMPGWRTTDIVVSAPSSTVKNFKGPTSIPFFTILITLDAGMIKAIEWDYGSKCDDCLNTGYCLSNLCGVATSTCASAASSNSTVSDCDYKVYVAWAGLDANSKYLISSGARVSRFRVFGANAAYTSAQNSASESFV